MEGRDQRGGDALRAARAAARAAREEARAQADQARLAPPDLDPDPDPNPVDRPPVFVDLPAPVRDPEPAEPEPEPGPDSGHDDDLDDDLGDDLDAVPAPALAPPPATPRAVRRHTPRWWAPALGLWAAVFVLATAFDDVVARVGAAVVLTLVGVALVAAVRAPERPLTGRRAAVFGGAVAVVALASWGAARGVHPVAGAVLAGLAMGLLAAAYDRQS